MRKSNNTTMTEKCNEKGKEIDTHLSIVLSVMPEYISRKINAVIFAIFTISSLD